jgi:hypothetical protein
MSGQTEAASQQAMNRFIAIWSKDPNKGEFWQKSDDIISLFQFAGVCDQVFGSTRYG